MNFFQMHERLRTELLRRVQRGDLTVALLAKQSGLGRSHISNFLHARGRLSIDALDRILAAQDLSAENLVDLGSRGQPLSPHAEAVPVVSQSAALFEPIIRLGVGRMLLHLPPGELLSLRPRPVRSRRLWRRFVAVRLDHDDACSMEPLLYGGAIVVIDRHYNHVEPCNPPRRNLYAVRERGRLQLRYIDLIATHLVHGHSALQRLRVSSKWLQKRIPANTLQAALYSYSTRSEVLHEGQTCY